MTDCLVDGRPVDVVPADDRGLLYGDALFETIAFHDTRAPLWPLHWQRLKRSASLLGIELPDEDDVLRDCDQLAPAGASVVMRVSLTRGSGGRAYFPDPDSAARRIVQRRPWPADLERQRREGLYLITSSVRLAAGSILVGLKHGNRLEQVLAARECAVAGADESIVFDTSGQVVEAIASNLIVEFADQVVTPRSESGVDGVGLAWLERQPEVELERVGLSGQDLESATGLMVINSVAGIRPVCRLDDRPLDVSERCRAWQRLWNHRLG
jgi:4-amino-4-deoxychorismate lyase